MPFYGKSGKPAVINDYITNLLHTFGDEIVVKCYRTDNSSNKVEGTQEEHDRARRLFYSNPSQQQRFDIDPSDHRLLSIEIFIPPHIKINLEAISSMDAVAILGHNLRSCGSAFRVVIKTAYDPLGYGTEWFQESSGLTVHDFDVLDPIDYANASRTTTTVNDVTAIYPEIDGFTVYKSPTVIQAGWGAMDGSFESEMGQEFVTQIHFKFEADETAGFLSNDVIVCSIMAGHFYEFPVSPDMEVSQEFEFDGVKTLKTIGGSEFSYTKHTGKNYNFSQGRLDRGWFSSGLNKPKGRRRFDVNFSAIGSKDLFPASITESFAMDMGSYTGYFMLNNDDDSDFGDWGAPVSGEKMYLNMDLTMDGAHFAAPNGFEAVLADSFYKNVIMLTMGGAVPILYINNIDSKISSISYNATNDGNVTIAVDDNIMWDQFHICRVDEKSFKFTQVNHNMWNISLSLYESF